MGESSLRQKTYENLNRKMSMPVEVSVEAVIENQIQEVTLDGQELYTQPLSMSENLTRLAHKIDFSKDAGEEKGKPTSEGEKAEEEKPSATFQPSLWPWDSVRNKLKHALTEMSVLVDVLNVAKEKRYMVLDPVVQEPPEARNAMHLMGKKKSLAAAAGILINGAERLRKPQIEAMNNRRTPDFHHELLRLRQNWRLRRQGSVILGDLSYKSSGSRFGQQGTFEVRKADDTGVVDLTDSPTPQKPASVLQVTVPSDLEGVAYIQVAIKRMADNVDLSNVELRLPTDISGTLPTDAHWQRKLEAAQNVIFCKEVFQQLAREAVQVNSKIPHMVVGNQIFSHLFPGFQLCIALCHNTEKDRKTSGSSGNVSKTPDMLPQASPSLHQKPEHNHVLEHSLHQLLRQMHFRNMYVATPHPVTASLGMSKRRRLAGPQAASRTELMEMTQTESLLEQIIKQARHIVLSKKTIQVLDELAVSIPEPQITAHWSNISSATVALIKVFITTQGYEQSRTPISLHVGIDRVKAVTKDGRVFNLSYETQELRDFIKCQVAQHPILVVQSLTKLMGWHVLSVNSHVGVGDVEQIGNALTILLVSPRGDRVMSIRSGPDTGLQVSVQKCPHPRPEDDGLVSDPKWTQLGGPFEKVHLDLITGHNIMKKIEILMACLAKEPSPKGT